MDITPLEILRALFISAFCGFFVLFTYDIFAMVMSEILSIKSNVYYFISDIFFIFTFTVVFILLLYYSCDGRVRGTFLGMMIFGMLLYHRVIRKTANKIIKILISPIKILIEFFTDVIKKMIKFLLQAIAKKRIKLYNKDVK